MHGWSNKQMGTTHKKLKNKNKNKKSKRNRDVLVNIVFASHHSPAFEKEHYSFPKLVV